MVHESLGNSDSLDTGLALSQRSSTGGISRTTPVDELPEMLSPEECRAYLGIGRSTMYELLRQNVIRHRRFGRSIRIPKSSLLSATHLR